MHAHDAVGIHPAEMGRRLRAAVVAVPAVALIPQPPHESRPRLGGAVAVPTRTGSRAGEPTARPGGDHDIEGVRRVTAVGGGIGERTDDVQILQDRHWPAVSQDQREGAGHHRAHVDEVDPLAVDLGRELWVAIQARLGFSPVVVGGPELDRHGHEQRQPEVPPAAGPFVRPPSAAQPAAQVVQIRLGNGDGERHQIGRHRPSQSANNVPGFV